MSQSETFLPHERVAKIVQFGEPRDTLETDLTACLRFCWTSHSIRCNKEDEDQARLNNAEFPGGDDTRTFVTGATGFIGRHTAERLVAAGHELTCLVRRMSDTSKLKKLDAALAVGDLTDRASLQRGMNGCEWVVNIAAAYSFWLPRKRTYADVNIGGTRNVMECALEAGVSKVVHVSTVAIYGRPAERPFNEDSNPGPVRFSEYARTKHEGDLIAWEASKTKGLPLVMVYPGGVLGPGDPQATGEYIQNLLNGRMPATVFDDVLFPWVHVRDVAEVIVRAAEKEHNISGKYLAVAQNLTFGQMNQMISEISGVALPRLRMPASLAMLNARLLTLMADIAKKPPLLGIAIDQMRTMKEGAEVDGSRVERELGITYTPIRVALQEAIASYTY
ncbi:MAG: NAD-dependent epimerase/dehydratase family protein [Candidatus Eisenbacteria bacterium]